MSEIKNKLVTGVIWESIGQFASLGIQFVVTIIIARILAPEDFGIIGLLTVFIAICNVLLDSGFSQALIQKKDATETDLSTIFFTNLFTGGVLYLVFYFLSPLIADFYNIPELTTYARILFIIVPVTSFGLIQNVIIQKKLLFKKSAIASIMSAFLSGIIGVTMAYNDFGVLSLVAQQLSMYFFRTLLYILQMRWKPKLHISFCVIQEMFSFSANLMFHSLVNTVMQNIYTLVIGKYYSPMQVGYYSQANRFQQISASTITTVIMKVSFPTLVGLKDNIDLMRNAYKKVLSMTCFIICPLMVLLITIAESLFSVLLTDRWLPAVIYFQILCLYGLTLPIMQISYNIYKLFKKGKILLILDAIRHLFFLISISTTIKYGISVLLFGQFSAMVLMSIVNIHYSSKLVRLSFMTILKTIFPYYLLAVIPGSVCCFLPKIDIVSLDLIFRTAIFLIIFYLSVTFSSPKAYLELREIVNQQKMKLQNNKK